MGDGETDGPIRLAIVDDHPLVATAIRAASEVEAASAAAREPSVVVIGVGRTLDEGLALVGPGLEGPDVVLCDIQLDGHAEGLAVLDHARRAGRKVIVLTSFDRASFMREAFARGASGFLSKAAAPDLVLDAVRRVAAGGTAFPADVLDVVRSTVRPPSEREREVLRGLRDGATNDEIGARLSISARTVESHLRRLFDRYGVLSRTELVVLALREGWIADTAR